MLAPLGVPVTGLSRTKGIVAWTGARRLLILKGSHHDGRYADGLGLRVRGARYA